MSENKKPRLKVVDGTLQHFGIPIGSIQGVSLFTIIPHDQPFVEPPSSSLRRDNLFDYVVAVEAVSGDAHVTTQEFFLAKGVFKTRANVLWVTLPLHMFGVERAEAFTAWQRSREEEVPA